MRVLSRTIAYIVCQPMSVKPESVALISAQRRRIANYISKQHRQHAQAPPTAYQRRLGQLDYLLEHVSAVEDAHVCREPRVGHGHTIASKTAPSADPPLLTCELARARAAARKLDQSSDGVFAIEPCLRRGVCVTTYSALPSDSSQRRKDE